MSLFGTSSYLTAFIILCIIGCIGLLCCFINVIIDWKKIKLTKPWNGPTVPPPTRESVLQIQLEEDQEKERNRPSKPVSSWEKDDKKSKKKDVAPAKVPVRKGVQLSQKQDAKNNRPQIPDVVVEDFD